MGVNLGFSMKGRIYIESVHEQHGAWTKYSYINKTDKMIWWEPPHIEFFTK